MGCTGTTDNPLFSSSSVKGLGKQAHLGNSVAGGALALLARPSAPSNENGLVACMSGNGRAVRRPHQGQLPLKGACSVRGGPAILFVSGGGDRNKIRCKCKHLCQTATHMPESSKEGPSRGARRAAASAIESSLISYTTVAKL